MNTKAMRELFENVIDKEKILDSLEDRIAYASDASLLEGLPSVIILVYCQEDFDNAVKICTKNKLKFLVRGKATGYTGGCVPQNDSVVISCENWKGIISFDEVKETAVFAPGTTIEEVNQFGSEYSLLFPPDPISKNHCTLGGAISENSSGPRCLRFGPLHCFIEEFQFYSADGVEHVIKKSDFTGMSDYFYSLIGSEGTLGAVGWVKVRLVKKPTEILLFCMEFETSSIIDELLDRCFRSGIPFSAMEMITPSYHTEKKRVGKYYLLLEYFSYSDRDKKMFFDKLNSYTKDLPVKVNSSSGIIYEVRGNAYQINRKLINDLIQKRPISLLVDGVVPRTALQRLVEEIFSISERNNVPMLDTFHFSDGNIHPTFFFENNPAGNKEKHKILGQVMEKCVELGGSLAAEHGIGLEKIDYIVQKHNKYEIEEFYRIKNKFDENNIVNPGKVLPQQKPDSKVINKKFDVKEKIDIDKINMTVVVDSDVKLGELRKKCAENNLNIGYLALNMNDDNTILEEIRECKRNLLSKRHGELKDSILGVLIREDGKDIVYGDRLVKNVSGYNICRSNETLFRNVSKICLRVFNNIDNHYYKCVQSNIDKQCLLNINAVSFDFTPLFVSENERDKYIIFASIFNKEELSDKGFVDLEEIDEKEINNYRIGEILDCDLDLSKEVSGHMIFNYQKGEAYKYEC